MTDSVTTSGISADSVSTHKRLESRYQQGGRHYFVDQESGKWLNIARLTAYAEYGEEIHDKVVHHEIPLLKIDAPRFLGALSREQHTEYHNQEPTPSEVDGFPILRAGVEP
jgi:hypothetical protein